MRDLSLISRGGRLALTVLLAVVLAGGCGLIFRTKPATTGPAAAKTAQKYVGVPYVLGGKSPRGFDCSGLTSYVYARHGVSLPRTAAQQAKVGRPVKKRMLKPGDLVFFKTNGRFRRVSHVGIYLGNDKFIHAPSPGKKVCVASLANPFFMKTYHSARRVG